MEKTSVMKKHRLREIAVGNSTQRMIAPKDHRLRSRESVRGEVKRQKMQMTTHTRTVRKQTTYLRTI